ncbi:MAG: hypothetical protein GVY19_12810, partial [Bacteroidetes bacterium]|nr:hypothetical protein [Bacteroidota bacterium]
MKYFNKIILLLIGLFFISGFGFKRLDYEDGRVNNVCKVLKGDVLVYFVFVDSKETYPWTEFDIQSTIDSMEVAIKWIERQAKKNEISLNIISDYHIGEEYTTVKRNLPMGTVLSTIEGSFKKGLEQLNEWGDDVAKRVGMSVEI